MDLASTYGQTARAQGTALYLNFTNEQKSALLTEASDQFWGIQDAITALVAEGERMRAVFDAAVEWQNASEGFDDGRWRQAVGGPGPIETRRSG
jgi:hypothetical protein